MRPLPRVVALLTGLTLSLAGAESPADRMLAEAVEQLLKTGKDGPIVDRGA